MPPAEAPFDWSYGTHGYMGGDGTMFWPGYLFDSDCSNHRDGVERYDLASLPLADCAAQPTADARFDCLRAAFAAATPIEVCVEPFVL